MGFDVDDYDRRVIKLTSEISEQVFPVSLPVDNPKFWERLASVYENTKAMAEARARGGLAGRLTVARLFAANALTLGRIYCMRAKKNVLPANMRLEPVW